MDEHIPSRVATEVSLDDMPQIIRRVSSICVSDDQCDCACAQTASYEGSRLVQIRGDQSYVAWYPTFSAPLKDEWTVVLAPNGLALLNGAALQVHSQFLVPESPNNLLRALPPGQCTDQIHLVLRQMVQLGLLSTVGAEPRPDFAPSTTLVVWLHLTDRCNLRCAYCYVPKTRRTMKLETGRRAIDAVCRSAVHHGFSSIKLKYAGGEPSLCFTSILSLNDYASYRTGTDELELSSVVLSNGVALTDQMLRGLVTHRIGLSISLDGIGDSHDVQRRRANGSSSATATLHTIERALMIGLNPSVTITVTNRNLGRLHEVVEWLLHRNIVFNINLYREHQFSHACDDLPIESDRLVSVLREVLKLIGDHTPQSYLASNLLDRIHLANPHRFACAAGSHYLVIAPDGRISRCQMSMFEPVTDVWTDDPLVPIRTFDNAAVHLPVEKKEQCSNCEWRYWCSGGCPLQTYRATSRYDQASPFCEVYRSLLPELVRLEGLALLSLTESRRQGV